MLLPTHLLRDDNLWVTWVGRLSTASVYALSSEF
jgi:hypothetical protein